MPLVVAYGTTAIERGLVRGGRDGIASYALSLREELDQLHEVVVQPFRFTGSSQIYARDTWGNFILQGLLSWCTGLPFPLAQRGINQGEFNVLHATDHLIPRLKRVPVVASIMDAIPLSHPECVGSKGLRYKTAFWKHSVQWASSIITISDHSKREIVRWFDVPEERISVVPLGVDKKWSAMPEPAELLRVKNKYALPNRFCLFVGTLQPRKNIRRIIDAHKSLPLSLRRECPLIIVGRHGWMCDAEVAELQGCQDGTMRWLQYVPSEDLLPVFKQATALVWPSLNEGFGLPVLEAFAANLAVVTSKTTSLPEVAGDAALLVDPENTGELADAMRQIATDDALRSELRARGLARAKQFTWDSTARLTVDVYRKAIGSSA